MFGFDFTIESITTRWLIWRNVKLWKCVTSVLHVQFTGISQQIVIAEIALKGCSLVSVGKGGPGRIYKNCEKLIFRDLEPSD